MLLVKLLLNIIVSVQCHAFKYPILKNFTIETFIGVEQAQSIT
jgi:hypothetical protein